AVDVVDVAEASDARGDLERPPSRVAPAAAHQPRLGAQEPPGLGEVDVIEAKVAAHLIRCHLQRRMLGGTRRPPLLLAANEVAQELEEAVEVPLRAAALTQAADVQAHLSLRREH